MAYIHIVMVASFISFVLFSIFGGLIKLSEAHKAPAMYVFGDSTVDVGNNNHLKLAFNKANFPHNGIDFPTTNATGRFSNGKILADFIAEKVGVASPPPHLSLLLNDSNTSEKVSYFPTGISFASGGAGIDKLTNIFRGDTISLARQIVLFEEAFESVKLQLGTSYAEKLIKQSIFTIAIGGSDLTAYMDNSFIFGIFHHNPQQFVNSLVQDLTKQLTQLYNLHARKFVIVGVGKIGCTPFERVKSVTGSLCNLELNQRSTAFNQAVKLMLNQLKFELKDLHYSYFNTYFTRNNKFITKPTLYGFTEVRAACCGLGDLNAEVPCLPMAEYCGNRNQYLFWDGSHLTEKAHRIMANCMYNHTVPYTFPTTLEQLVHI